MNEKSAVGDVPQMEMVFEWEGQALYAPGVAFAESVANRLPHEADTAALVDWLAQVACATAFRSPDYESLRKSVLAVLAQWHAHFGHAKIDNVKKQLFEQLKQHRSSQTSAADIQQRIDWLFGEIRDG